MMNSLLPPPISSMRAFSPVANLPLASRNCPTLSIIPLKISSASRSPGIILTLNPNLRLRYSANSAPFLASLTAEVAYGIISSAPPANSICSIIFSSAAVAVSYATGAISPSASPPPPSLAAHLYSFMVLHSPCGVNSHKIMLNTLVPKSRIAFLIFTFILKTLFYKDKFYLYFCPYGKI